MAFVKITLFTCVLCCLFLYVNSSSWLNINHKVIPAERDWSAESESNKVSQQEHPSSSSASSKNWMQLRSKIKTANKNLQHSSKLLSSFGSLQDSSDNSDFLPGQPAESFTVNTLSGILSYPSPALKNKSIIFHTFDIRSGFVECLWTSKSSLNTIASSPASVHYVFMSPSANAVEDAIWMQQQLDGILKKMVANEEIRINHAQSLQDRFHFVTTPSYQLGNWISAISMNWACQDHGCGLAQAVFNTGKFQPIILKRLDARYDWLPSPGTFTTPMPVSLAGDGCQVSQHVQNKIAVVINGNCSYSTKVTNMQASSAHGVIVYSQPGEHLQDMNCEGAECDSPPGIAATMIPYSQELIDSLQSDATNVSFQTSASENFYFATDAQGLLAEMGWLLYPSFQFFVWQAEWFDFRTQLLANLSQQVMVMPVFNETIMQGKTGVVKTIQLPPLLDFSRIELDASLSCPGTRDEECPPWDHTVQLYVCCDKSSPLCGMELGRWITPFRRRIGRWLTDVSPLAPLLTSNTCTFTMQTAWWAQAWKPSLNIRLHKATAATRRPFHIVPLFRGGTFDKSYNTKYKPINFTLTSETKQVVLYSVITGHGSDNNGCGEFCVTSHHFIVNGHSHVNTFTNAGTPLGCANRTPTGVEPNEHGTWLYGRDGWCDGREVDPWVVDISSQVTVGSSNSIRYFGWFDGKDPNPTSNPGEIIMYSYLVYYK